MRVASGVAQAPAATVWELVSDASSYPAWGPCSAGGYHSRGDRAADGAGAIRWFRYGRTITVEEVVAAEAARRLAYTVVKGIPVRNYRAEVTLSPAGEGTQVCWSASWDRTLGGRIVGRRLRSLYPRIVGDLIAAAERAAPGGQHRQRTSRGRAAG